MGGFTAPGLEGREVFHIKLSHMVIIRFTPRRVLGTLGADRLAGRLQKVHVNKIPSCTIASYVLDLETTSQNNRRPSVFNGTQAVQLQHVFIETWMHFLHANKSAVYLF